MTFLAIYSLFRDVQGEKRKKRNFLLPDLKAWLKLLNDSVLIMRGHKKQVLFPAVMRPDVSKSLLDVKLLSDIPPSSLWLRKRSVCVEERGRCCRDCVAFPILGVFDPSDTQILFAEWAGKGGEKRNTLQKNVLQEEKKEIRGSERKQL